MSNHLIHQSSPYLLQHAQNPVDWYPWEEEAFQKAKKEDKPIFLSVGYSTCHWCHVMAHECFENKEIASILNQYFISIKVDREERPDIDSVYMSVCQALTGSGGWPMSIFLTAEQKPFFAGTYYPPYSRPGIIGFQELLLAIADKWKHHRSDLTTSAENILTYLTTSPDPSSLDLLQNEKTLETSESLESLCHKLTKEAAAAFSKSFDKQYGGFGKAPKFPLPHNILFLILYSQIYSDSSAWEQANITLEQMRRGGIFDQIGYGFSRYSTDSYYLVPHFEKMLYDNALLILAYSIAYKVSRNPLFLDTAEKTATYILREMTGDSGEFYSAQDADSEGEEGKFYTWDYQEICDLLGEKVASSFCQYFNITKQGNFEGKNIPNLLNKNKIFDPFEQEKMLLYQYRKSRYTLHLDDKILTTWNSLMILAMSTLYQITGHKQYLLAAKKAFSYIETYLSNGSFLYVSYHKNQSNDKNSMDAKNFFSTKDTSYTKGFLEEYAYYTAALLSLYQATSFPNYLIRAEQICQEAQRQFEDTHFGGYFLYGLENNTLITKPKETYDGALPSGNSVMAYCLVQLFHITGKDIYQTAAKKQLFFLSSEAESYPAGYSMFLIAFLLYFHSYEKITVVLAKPDTKETLLPYLPLFAEIKILSSPTNEYPLLNNKTTYYICKNHTCMPPTNTLTP